ncbi:MAG TPA: sigma-70 family RNA polymerase sigma factor [Gemmata sp.]
MTTEAEMLARLRAGDHTAYEQLVRAHTPTLTAIARRFFGDTAATAEAVQDTFVSAFQAMGAFEGTSKLGTWLHRIAVNACLLKVRSRKRGRSVPLEGDALAAPSGDGDTRLSQAETCARVRACVELLPEAYRTVIQLRDLEGRSTEETARYLGTSDGAVKTRLHRARQALKTILEPHLANAV